MGGDTRGLDQSNVGSRPTVLPLRFFVLVILTGVAAGLGAIAMMGVLRAVQHATFSYSSGEFVTAVAAHSDLRRVAVLCIGGLVTGLGLWLIRSHLGGTGGEPTQVVWTRTGDLSLLRTLASGALSELSVAMGGSLGREAAPQRIGAAAAAFLARRVGLLPDQRRLLIACGAGAGLAAVYNVPLAGAIFVAEIYLDSFELSTVLPALIAATVATAVAWITLPAHALYTLPTLPAPNPALVVFAVVLGPIAGLAATGFVKLVAWASDRRPDGARLVLQPLMAFAALGIIAIRYPLLLGNGTDLAQFAFTGSAGILVLLALAALKPLVTAGCLRSGATGGLFTPTLSFGAVLGAFAGQLWAHAWPGSPAPAYAAIGAAAVLAAATEAPVTAVAFLLELAPGSIAVAVPILLAVCGATIVAHRLDLRSIYSARLTLEPREPESPHRPHR